MTLFALCTTLLYGFVFAVIFSALRAIRSLERRFRLRLGVAICLFLLIISGGVYAYLAPENPALFL